MHQFGDVDDFDALKQYKTARLGLDSFLESEDMHLTLPLMAIQAGTRYI